ncbi:hypothetical protein SESBI_04123 [Sesbania bispinosa]|nr:hypothetical protein SESBI_04123 [Sesbania bispinosa]
MPTFKDYVKSSMNPTNYMDVMGQKSAVKVKHFNAVSSLSLNKEERSLYIPSSSKQASLLMLRARLRLE